MESSLSSINSWFSGGNADHDEAEESGVENGMKCYGGSQFK